MRKFGIHKVSLLTGAALAALSFGGALSQEAAGTQLDEVVVTA